MTRTLPALLALVAATATMSLATPAPALADGGTYDDLSTITFRDAAGDAAPGKDLLSSDAELDPNLARLHGETALGGGYPTPTFVVLRLGELVSGTCEIQVEVVSDRFFDYVVRNPGESTLPEHYGHGSDYDYVTVEDPRLGLVPTCAVLDLVDEPGNVLDTVTGVVTHRAAGRAVLGISSEVETILNIDSGADGHVLLKTASRGGAAYDVALDAVAGDPGLSLGRTQVALGGWDGPRNSQDVRLGFTAGPGLHTLTLRLSAGNAATKELTVRIWGRGGPGLVPRDSLAGRGFFAEKDYYGSSQVSVRVWTAYSFLDDTWVRLSAHSTWKTVPPAYLPCRRVTESCLRYAYDARTGAVQIGADRGELRNRSLRFDRVHDHAVKPARAGATVSFVGASQFEKTADYGKSTFRLTLRQDGTFTRVSQLHYFQNHPVTQRGRYRVGQDGVLVARTSKGRVLRTGLAFVLDAQGRPRPQTLGVYAFDVWFHPVDD